MADPRVIGEDMHAFMIQRGMEQALYAVTQDGQTLTEDERDWLEVGIASGVLAALQCLTEAGWIRGPRTK